MELSALTIRVLLLFFPGVLCAMLVDSLTVHRERTTAQFLTHAFILGLGSYLSLYAARSFCGVVAGALGLPPPLPISFFSVLLSDRSQPAWGEIVLAAGSAVVLGTGVSAAINHKVIHRWARTLQVTRKRGDVDLWATVFDSPRTNWINVRDLEHGLTYYGWVDGFSATGERAELLLRNVAVFESDKGTKLYDTDRVYLSQDSRSLVIDLMQHGRQGAESGGPTDTSVRGRQVQPWRVEPQSDHA